ncbi:hypothetical protein ACTXJ5_01195 [Psychrobacter alimentarius]|uniref:hypothetical protein n=1 Tax=Psychrobacter alimentarius TaxID=261164 RepID=UPI003FD0A5E3
MSNYLNFLISMLAIFSLSGCTTYRVEKPPIVQVDMPQMTVVSEPMPAKPTLQIATWSPAKTDGRFVAMTAGYLTKFNNCLALTRDNEEVMTQDNTLLLVLADTSFSWNADKEILLFEGKSYKIGDELYLGGGSFTYPKGILTGENIKLSWIDCGLNKGWLGG